MKGIELVRGLAALMVVVHHLWSLSSLPRFAGYWVIEGFGSYGVNVFFVLSAFLLSPACWRIKRVGDLRVFWVRRVARIMPAYLCNIVILFLFFIPVGVLFTSTSGRQLLSNLTFTHYLRPHTSSSLGVNGVLWTLSIEMMLYLLLPFIGIAFVRFPLLVAAVMTGIGVLWRAWIGISGDGIRRVYFGDMGVPESLQSLFIARQFVGYLPLFAMGMVLRWMYDRDTWGLRRWRPAFNLWTAIVLLVPGGLFLRFVERSSQYNHWVWFSLFDLAVALLAVPAIFLAAGGSVPVSVCNRFGMWLGSRSYGIYLWHFPLILVAYERGTGMATPVLSNVWLRIAFVVILTALLAEVSFRSIEMPAQRWAKRFEGTSTR